MRLTFDPMTGHFAGNGPFQSLPRHIRIELLERVRGWVKEWDNCMGRRFHVDRPRTLPVAFWQMDMAPRLQSLHRNVFEVVLLCRPRYGCWREWHALPPKTRRDFRFAVPKFMRPASELQRIKEVVVNARDMAQIALAPPLIDKAPIKPPLGARPDFSPWRHGEDFIVKLRKRGYVELGRGCFSAVLAKPGSKRVIKVNFRTDPWLDYVVWAAKEGQAGRFAPKVFSYRRFNVGLGSEFYVAVMERLNGEAYQLEWKRPSQYNAYRALVTFIHNRQDEDGIMAERHLPGAISFAVAFRHAFKGKRFDLHGSNWMMREDGSMVCTDPLSDGSTTAPQRMRHRDLVALAPMPANR